MPARKFTRQDLRVAAEKYKNWGKWGPNDEIGTLNYTAPEDIVAAAQLVRKGKVISLALQLRPVRTQGGKTKYPPMDRINPLHLMLRTGTDAYSGVLDKRGIRASDDIVVMPLQSGTQWDGLGHIFYENHMWNGYDCREVTAPARRNAASKRPRTRWSAAASFSTCRACSARRSWTTATPSPPRISRRPPRPGRQHQARRLRDRAHRADGALPAPAAGTAIPAATPRLRLRNARVGPQDRDCGDRQRHLGLRGAAERNGRGINQPWHWIAIPIMGMTMGEIFHVGSWPRIAPPTGSTNSCSSPPRSRSPARSARRPIRSRSSRRAMFVG